MPGFVGSYEINWQSLCCWYPPGNYGATFASKKLVLPSLERIQNFLRKHRVTERTNCCGGVVPPLLSPRGETDYGQKSQEERMIQLSGCTSWGERQKREWKRYWRWVLRLNSQWLEKHNDSAQSACLPGVSAQTLWISHLYREEGEVKKKFTAYPGNQDANVFTGKGEDTNITETRELLRKAELLEL